MKKAILFLVLFMAMFAIGCGSTEAQKSQYGKAPDFQIKDINGQPVKLSDYSGKIVILNFFATWCPPCRMEMPDFERIARNYPNDVKILAINVGRESVAKVKDFVSENSITFTVAMDDGNVSNLYGPIRGIPVTVIIDKNMNIAQKYIGMRTEEVFVKNIRELAR